MKTYQIEQVDNGYLLTRIGSLPSSREVYMNFADVVNALAFDFCLVGVGEKWTEKLTPQDSGRERDG